jgi:glucose-1-phosphate adenylyltransferase
MAFVLAGGRGSRLRELTDRRVKPAVYFGGKARIIDFALSNAVNSGIRKIGVATQYKAHSLIRHIQRGWDFFRAERNEFLDIMPASQRMDEESWYRGTADAVAQNIDIIDSYDVDYIIILAGDHIYKMDYEVMIREHADSDADVTVGCLTVPREEASAFGVWRPTNPAGSRASSRSPRTRPPRRRTRPSRWPPWASTSSPGRSCGISCAATCRTTAPPTTSAMT